MMVMKLSCFILLFFARNHKINSFTPNFRRNLSKQYRNHHHHHHHITTVRYMALPFNHENSQDKKVGFYIHIPYCRKRCRYCDFAIVPIGFATEIESNENDNTSRMRQKLGFDKMNEEYTNAIITEIDCLVHSILKTDEASSSSSSNDEKCSQSFTKKKIHLNSIYFGGGTPSLAPSSTIKTILSHLLSTTATNEPIFYTTNQTEITMEMDPGTFNIQYLNQVKSLGVNRISLGVQAFDDEILSYIGRIHTTQDIYNSIQMIHSVYGDEINYSIDLISGLPGVDENKWKKTLERVMDLKPVPPNHLSIYDLQIESGTVFGNWYHDTRIESSDEGADVEQHRKRKRIEERNGKSNNSITALIKSNKNEHSLLTLPSPDDCASMYEYASSFLHSKGYEHYEISSYAKRKEEDSLPSSLSTYRSNHNQIYWEIESEWYALGLGATSCISRMRYSRPRTLSDYIQWTKDLRIATSNNLIPPWLDEKESWEHDIEDIVMTRLRTKEGLNFNWILNNQENGEDLVNRILLGAKLGMELGLVKRDTRKEELIDRLYLTDPKGFLFSNTIISSIFGELW